MIRGLKAQEDSQLPAPPSYRFWNDLPPRAQGSPLGSPRQVGARRGSSDSQVLRKGQQKSPPLPPQGRPTRGFQLAAYYLINNAIDSMDTGC